MQSILDINSSKLQINHKTVQNFESNEKIISEFFARILQNAIEFHFYQSNEIQFLREKRNH